MVEKLWLPQCSAPEELFPVWAAWLPLAAVASRQKATLNAQSIWEHLRGAEVGSPQGSDWWLLACRKRCREKAWWAQQCRQLPPARPPSKGQARALSMSSWTSAGPCTTPPCRHWPSRTPCSRPCSVGEWRFWQTAKVRVQLASLALLQPAGRGWTKSWRRERNVWSWALLISVEVSLRQLLKDVG